MGMKPQTRSDHRGGESEDILGYCSSFEMVKQLREQHLGALAPLLQGKNLLETQEDFWEGGPQVSEKEVAEGVLGTEHQTEQRPAK